MEDKVPNDNNKQNFVQKLLALKEKLTSLKKQIEKHEKKESIQKEVNIIENEIESVINNNKSKEEKKAESILNSPTPPLMTFSLKIELKKFERSSQPSTLSFIKNSWTVLLWCHEDMKNPKNVYLLINDKIGSEETTIYFEITIKNKDKSKNNLTVKEKVKPKDKKIYIDFGITKEELTRNYVQSINGEDFVELTLSFKYDYYSHLLGI